MDAKELERLADLVVERINQNLKLGEGMGIRVIVCDDPKGHYCEPGKFKCGDQNNFDCAVKFRETRE